MKTDFKNWHINIDDQHICWLGFDRAGNTVNSLDKKSIAELDEILDELKKEKKLKGVAIFSKKEKGFIAGADITQFTELQTVDEAMDLVRQAQKAFDKLGKFKTPTLVMIDGFCLGGGLELSLACTYRLSIDDPSVKIGLPEVKLGIHPGWGGTIRLPKLIGAIEAMKLILTGKTLVAKQAKKLGVVDEVVRNEDLLKKAANYYLLKQPKKHRPSILQRLTNFSFIRKILAKKFYSNLEKKIKREHYPAPFAVVDNWLNEGIHSNAAMLKEAKSICDLFLHDTSRQLVRVFFLQEQMKATAKQTDFNPQHIHVIGAGTMGGDIASWCALRGYTVTLQDREATYLAPAIKRAHKLFKKKLRKPRLIQAAMDRLQIDIEGNGLKKADVVIEAIFEDIKIKQALYKEIEPKLQEHTLLATNTSSLPLEELGKALKKPERLVGVHFFNPVSMMQLVEVVRGEKTSDEEYNKALTFVSKISRLPLPVSSHAGFLINRILMPYIIEAVRMMDEGVPPAHIDKAAVDFGMPMGPIELADTVGLDICLSVANILLEHYGGDIPKSIEKYVEGGHLGRKTSRGIYTYRDGKPVKVSLYQEGPIPEDLTDRLILCMVNESISCLRDKVVDSHDMLDAGMIFGTGFAPFRGGPMAYAKKQGFDKLYKKLTALHKVHGDRFKPDDGWKELINA